MIYPCGCKRDESGFGQCEEGRRLHTEWMKSIGFWATLYYGRSDEGIAPRRGSAIEQLADLESCKAMDNYHNHTPRRAA